jgi:hypothetical protein
MNPDSEGTLRSLTPRGADRSLRQRVLDEVGRELAARKPARWRRLIGPAVAASIVLAFGANVGITHWHETRLAGIFGPPSIPGNIREMVAIVESVTDRETAHLVEQRLLAASRPEPSFEENIRVIEKYFRNLNALGKEDRREKIEEDRQDRSDHPGRAPGLGVDRERRVYLDYRLPA